MKNIVVIQARLTSTRFPNKILQPLHNNLNSLQLIRHRLSFSKLVDKVIFAIPDDFENDKLSTFLSQYDYNFVRGSLNNLVSRHLDAVQDFDDCTIIRVTSDCPLVDPLLLDDAIKQFISGPYDYVSTYTPPEKSVLCNGSDIEIFSKALLKHVRDTFTKPLDQEHVTFAMWDGRLRINTSNMNHYFKDKIPFTDVRITLDYPEDLLVIKKILSYLNTIDATLPEIVDAYRILGLQTINGHFDSRAGWN